MPQTFIIFFIEQSSVMPVYSYKNTYVYMYVVYACVR